MSQEHAVATTQTPNGTHIFLVLYCKDLVSDSKLVYLNSMQTFLEVPLSSNAFSGDQYSIASWHPMPSNFAKGSALLRVRLDSKEKGVNLIFRFYGLAALSKVKRRLNSFPPAQVQNGRFPANWYLCRFKKRKTNGCGSKMRTQTVTLINGTKD